MADERVDALTELVTLGIGRSAEVLNLILNSHIDLSAPVIRILDAGDLPEALEADDKRLSAISMRYNGSMDGVAEPSTHTAFSARARMMATSRPW